MYKADGSEVSGIPFGSYLLNFHQKNDYKENTASNLTKKITKTYLKRIAEKTNMKQSLNFQMARHTCFSNLQRTGATFAQILEISGHSRTESLRNYLNKLKPEDMQTIVERL